MQQIKDLINRLLWDKKEDISDYSFFYMDRITKRSSEIRGSNIKRAEGSFIVIERENEGKIEEVEIPMHRVREVKKKGVVVFKR